MIARTLIAAAVLAGGLLIATPDAEARGFRGRRAFRPAPRTSSRSIFTPTASAKRRVDYNLPQLNQAEKRFFYQQQAYFDHAFNGFSPYDFK